MKTLLIDAGNSSLKWAMLDGDMLLKQTSIGYADRTPVQVIKEVLKAHQGDCNSLLMVTVLGRDFVSKTKGLAADNSIDFNNIESKQELAGIKNAYLQAHKLGADRLVGMIAAYDLLKVSNSENKAFIVIDSGTATTVDAVNKDGEHLGGVIMPGLNLCTDSLLKNTKLLPLWNKAYQDFKPDCFCKETTQAIASGSLIGLAGAIDGICLKMEKEMLVNEYKQKVGINKIICGGNANKLIPHLGLDYQLQDDLLMQGLKVIHNGFLVPTQ